MNRSWLLKLLRRARNSAVLTLLLAVPPGGESASGQQGVVVYARITDREAGIAELPTANTRSKAANSVGDIPGEAADGEPTAGVSEMAGAGDAADSIRLWLGNDDYPPSGPTTPFTLSASPVTEWLTFDRQLKQAQFQQSQLPETPLSSRVGSPSAANPLNPSDVVRATTTAPRYFGLASPVATVSALQPLVLPTSSGIDSLLLAAQATSGQHRQPTATENVLRGRRKGQTPGGSHWIPTREDLDTMLSKIDSRIVEKVTVVGGPYNVMEGPGLAFYDVDLLRAPRYENGYESHGQTLLEYQTNGEQWHGRQSFAGGDRDWGFLVGYSHRTGSDYESGNGLEFPSSYNSRVPNVALGVDVTENSTVDFHYLRLDQTGVEFPGQVFDIDFLITDAYAVNYNVRDQRLFDTFNVEAWYNRTRFNGNANSPRKRQQIPVLEQLFREGFTDADGMTAGGTAYLAWGDAAEYVRAGSDFRYADQSLNETTTTSFPLNNPIPRSHSIDPGLFVETQWQPRDFLTARMGSRVDWVSTNAADTAMNALENLSANVLLAPFDQQFSLWAAFVSVESRLNDDWTLSVSGGHSMRPPTLTEMYAVLPFLAVMPQFLFNAPYGNPNLSPERQWQIDAGLSHESDDVRAGINGFHAWVLDYITFDAAPTIVPFTDPSAVPFNYTWVNTELATLAGANAYFDLDLTDCWQSFARLAYIDGRDRTRLRSNSPIRDAFGGSIRSETSFRPASDAEPLPVMPPLESRVGLRRVSRRDPGRWQVEFSARIVDNQDRVATSLFELPTPGFTTFDARGFWYAREQLRLTAGVENLGNRNYQEHFDPHLRSNGSFVLQPGRNFFLAAEWLY